MCHSTIKYRRVNEVKIVKIEARCENLSYLTTRYWTTYHFFIIILSTSFSVIVYLTEIAFATSSQRIVVQVKRVEGASVPQPTPAPDHNSHVTLTDEEKLKLNEGKKKDVNFDFSISD